ncbi:MAG: cobyric acid synthase [Bacteroidales bacterium]|nr:cobyric acid synthase [Bacteroidales bacterium]
MYKQLHPIMFAGTGSDVGKSVIATAFCRIFLQDGYNPAPYKAQNMSLNSYATLDGLEIGRAQAVQASAAGIDCHTDMNPILIKPYSDNKSQIVLNGIPYGNQDACSYFNKKGQEFFKKEVYNAYDRLEKRYNPIVLEGAGSIAEINLKEGDLVNMSMAMYAQADVILIADIERGGVFASVYGTLLLLEPEERVLVKGIIINKFRGDLKLFESGVRKIEALCNVPVLGVIPFFKDIYIEEEDSVSLATKENNYMAGKINVVVVLLQHISNFTDFDLLERDPRVHLYYSNNGKEIEKADIILIPGTKSTLSDMYEIRKNSVAQSILKSYKNGATIMGICGGFQIMGQTICDPMHIEGKIEQIPGLGLLPVDTVIEGEKITRQVNFKFHGSAESCRGYEIHMGSSFVVEGAKKRPLNKLCDGSEDGYYLNIRCMGSYIHGILDNNHFIDFLLSPFNDKLKNRPVDIKQYKEDQFDKLADYVRKYIDVQKIYNILSI